MLENTTEMNMLYDFYHPLLTQKQISYLDMYHREDYSLGEIGELTKVSRQAVYDTIRRTEKSLLSYEEKLGLYKKFKERQALFTELEHAVTHDNQNKAIQLIEQLKNID